MSKIKKRNTLRNMESRKTHDKQPETKYGTHGPWAYRNSLI